MIIVGHSLISYEKIYLIKELSSINKVPQDSICLFKYSEEFIFTCKKKEIKFALHVKDEKEAILGNALKASFLLCDEVLAKKVQNLAEYYLFDSKVALLINSINNLESAIEKRVDMAILKSAISQTLP